MADMMPPSMAGGAGGGMPGGGAPAGGAGGGMPDPAMLLRQLARHGKKRGRGGSKKAKGKRK